MSHVLQMARRNNQARVPSANPQPTTKGRRRIKEDRRAQWTFKTMKDEDKKTKPSLRDRLLKLRQRGVLFLLIVLPYLVGVVWHGLHPFVSVFTGQNKPRGLYVDENSAEPHYFRINHAKFKRRDQLVQRQYQKHRLSSLCRAVSAVTGTDPFTLDRGNLSCRAINDAVDVLQITPLEGPVLVQSEAIVFALPAAEHWIDSPVHAAFLALLVELVKPQFTWLAKTVYVVAPRIRNGQVLTTAQAVNVFLEAYLGPSSDTDQTVKEVVGGIPTMPPGMISSALLRQLIVWDQEIIAQSTTQSSIKLPIIRLLPQGPRGLLPNMDLVSVVRAALQRSVGSNVQYEIHPYQEKSLQYGEKMDLVCQYLMGRPCPTKELSALLNLFFFQHALRGHDFTTPHAVALERGIDALTVQFVGRPLTGNDRRTSTAASKLPSAMEVALRSLSNLHERLHHSTALYLLLDLDHFVKHEEYLVPNLLLLIPLIVRAATLFLVDLEDFDWHTVSLAVEQTMLGTVFICGALELVDFVDTHSWWTIADEMSARHAVVGLFYLYLAGRFILDKKRWSSQSRRSVQFFACICSLYMHVAIAFGHVSLAFPSALLWTPLLAFPFYPETPESTTKAGKVHQGVSQALAYALFLLLVPFVGFVPYVLPSYTPYVRYAYVPLHLMASHLWLS